MTPARLLGGRSQRVCLVPSRPPRAAEAARQAGGAGAGAGAGAGRGWLSGRQLAGNLLVERGRLTGVIDFGGLGRGDPAVEVWPGWSLFDARARAAYREALGFDEAAWVRGWAWMLSVSLYWLADLWDSINEQDPTDAIGQIHYIVRHRHD